MVRKVAGGVIAALLIACSSQHEHTAAAVNDADSAVAAMTSYGVNMLISDSGVIKYRILAEESISYQNCDPKKTVFIKGLFMTQFDESFHVESYIQCDTAYRYEDLRLYELRGRVRVLTKNGTRFRGEELFWDQNAKEYYSNMYSEFETPERSLQGNYFRSDEKMEKYYVSNSSGSFINADHDEEVTENEEVTDSVEKVVRQPERPREKGKKAPPARKTPPKKNKKK